MTTLLEQVEVLDFETRKKISVALAKRPEKSKEDLILDELRYLRSEIVAYKSSGVMTTKPVVKKDDTSLLLWMYVICYLIFLIVR